MRKVVWAILLILGVVLNMRGNNLLASIGIGIDYLMIVIVLLAVWSGPVSGAVAGLICGLILDITVGSAIGLYGLAYGLAGLLPGLVRERFSGRDHFVFPVASCAILIVIKHVGLLCFYFLVGAAMPSALVFVKTVALEALASSVIAIGVFYLLTGLYKTRLMQAKGIFFLRNPLKSDKEFK